MCRNKLSSAEFVMPFDHYGDMNISTSEMCKSHMSYPVPLRLIQHLRCRAFGPEYFNSAAYTDMNPALDIARYNSESYVDIDGTCCGRHIFKTPSRPPANSNSTSFKYLQQPILI